LGFTMSKKQPVDFSQFKGVKFDLETFLQGLDPATEVAKELAKGRQDELFMEAVSDNVRMKLMAETLEFESMDASELPDFVINCIKDAGARNLETASRAKMLISFSRELFQNYTRRITGGEFNCS
jgi:hypothetical protein